MVIFQELISFRQMWKKLIYRQECRTFPCGSPRYFLHTGHISTRKRSHIRDNMTDPIKIKSEHYLVWRFDIHVYSPKVSMHNVFTVKVVTRQRDLRQKHYYVLLLTLSSKNVLFESAMRKVGTWDLTNRRSRVMIFPNVTRRNWKNPTAFTSFWQQTRLLHCACTS